MTWNILNRIFFILLAVFLCTACNEEDVVIKPVAGFNYKPNQNTTIDTVVFDANSSVSGRSDQKLYYRWNLNADESWDNEYSRTPTMHYRFYAPGDYRIALEVINSSGQTDTISKDILIEQGYSYPHPDFFISPQKGNYLTEYLFDASITKDDEDSLETLLFRWDFRDDGFWDVDFTSSPLASYTYQDSGRFTIRLEVKDPSKRISSKETEIHVTNINYDLIADFSWSPEFATQQDSIMFDASASYLIGNPDASLWYSWKLPPEYEWSEWTEDPVIYRHFGSENTYQIELKVKDSDSLLNYKTKEIRIYHENLPPITDFRIGCIRGNIKTQFYFDSWLTEDLESLPTELKVRWDFNGDGFYDTEFSGERKAHHQYSLAGTYEVTLEAIDPEGLSSTKTKSIEVSPWENETGLIWDQRDDQYYGTVKIGDQWWMSENLNFAPYDPNKDEVKKLCYQRFLLDTYDWCNVYGGLYNLYHATRNDIYGEVKGICPRGWHMPSKQEWDQMINYIGGYNQAQKLMPGGPTDFNALMGGYGEWKYDPVLKYYRYIYRWGDYATYFWSFTPIRGSIIPTSSWNVTLFKDQDKIYPGFSSNEMYFYVRCVKGEE
jgi:uncharacterized protein (TIGR02145 family)